MSARDHRIDERNTRARAGAFLGNLIPALSLFFIGYPVGRAALRTVLIGWFLILVAITQFILRHCFQRTAEEQGRGSLRDGLAKFETVR